jgi:hypothetical protein
MAKWEKNDDGSKSTTTVRQVGDVKETHHLTTAGGSASRTSSSRGKERPLTGTELGSIVTIVPPIENGVTPLVPKKPTTFLVASKRSRDETKLFWGKLGLLCNSVGSQGGHRVQDIRGFCETGEIVDGK